MQVTIPKVVADKYQIRPGDDIDWVPAGDAIRVSLSGSMAAVQDRESQLRLFDQATARHRGRATHGDKQPAARGWSREDLYDRGRSR